MPDEQLDANDASDRNTELDDAALLRTYLATHDLPCPVCGYELHLIESNRCPECGANLDLRVGSSDLRLMWWITSLVSFTIPLGFFGVMTTIATGILISRGFASGQDWSALISAAAASVVFAVIVALLIRNRRRFWSLSPRRQRLIGLASLVLAGFALGTFFVSFFSEM